MRHARTCADLSALRPGERFSPQLKFQNVMIPWGLLKAKINVDGKLSKAKNKHGGKLSIAAKVCWGALAYYAGEDDFCYPLQQTIARDMGVAVDRVKDYIAELEAAGLIEVEYKSTGRIRQSYYYFIWNPCLIDGSDDRAKLPPRKALKEVVKTPLRNIPDEVVKTPPPDEVTRWRNCPRRSGEITPDEVVKTPLAIKEEEIHLRDSVKRGKQASGIHGLESSLEQPLARPQIDPESLNPETQNPSAADVENIRQLLIENGIDFKAAADREEHPAEMVRIAGGLGCAVGLLAEFIRAKIAEKAAKVPPESVDLSSRMLRFVREDLGRWLVKPAGKAAAAAIDAATRPPVPRECGGCRGTGIKASSPVSWCHCALGEQRKERHEPVFVKRDECLNCASTLGWHLRENPEKTLCFFCSRPEQNGSRAVTEFELATARTQLQTRGPIPNCEPCGKRGYLSRNAGQEEELIKFCTCNWGARLRRLKGENWDEEQTQLARDLWQQLNAACPGKPCKSEAELRLHTADRRLVTEP